MQPRPITEVGADPRRFTWAPATGEQGNLSYLGRRWACSMAWEPRQARLIRTSTRWLHVMPGEACLRGSPG